MLRELHPRGWSRSGQGPLENTRSEVKQSRGPGSLVGGSAIGGENEEVGTDVTAVVGTDVGVAPGLVAEVDGANDEIFRDEKGEGDGCDGGAESRWWRNGATPRSCIPNGKDGSPATSWIILASASKYLKGPMIQEIYCVRNSDITPWT